MFLAGRRSAQGVAVRRQVKAKLAAGAADAAGQVSRASRRDWAWTGGNAGRPSQVQRAIDEATDAGRLSQLYEGWTAWV